MEELGLCLEPKQLPTAVLLKSNNGNKKERNHAADVRPREESSGNHDFTYSNGICYCNLDHTLYDDFYNNCDRCVIAGIRRLVPRGHQRQEMSAPRLFSNNGTNQQQPKLVVQQRAVREPACSNQCKFYSSAPFLIVVDQKQRWKSSRGRRFCAITANFSAWLLPKIEPIRGIREPVFTRRAPRFRG